MHSGYDKKLSGLKIILSYFIKITTCVFLSLCVYLCFELYTQDYKVLGIKRCNELHSQLYRRDSVGRQGVHLKGRGGNIINSRPEELWVDRWMDGHIEGQGKDGCID